MPMHSTRISVDAGAGFRTYSAWMMAAVIFLSGAWHIAAAAAVDEPETVWVEDGAAQIMIVTADEPYPIAEYAARELAYHIELATGAEPPVVAESEVGDGEGPRVFVGQSDAAREKGIYHDDLESEQCVIRSVDGDLFIVGNDGPGHPLNQSNTHSGTLWGTYEVIEHELKASWLWPGELGTVVPGRERVAVGEWDRTFRPELVRRNIRTGINFRGGEEVDRFDYSLWGRLRVPGRYGIAYSSEDARDRFVWDQMIFLRRHRAGRSDDPRPYTGHALRRIGWEQYGESHPEWFQKLPEGEIADEWRRRHEFLHPDRDPYVLGEIPEGGWEGRRGPVDPDRSMASSMCVSNEQLQQELIDRWAEQRKDDPGAVLQIGEADMKALCACESCLALDAEQPTKQELAELPAYPAYTQYTPVNAGRRYAVFAKRVHEKAREIDPDALVSSFVYLNYFVAPDDLELHENIILSFCPWGGWHFPRDPREQQWLREQWHAWLNTGATLYYRPNYLLGAGAMPHVYTHQMHQELLYFYENEMIATDFDTLTGQWAVHGPTLYLVSRFHSRPEASTEELLDEYYAAFGPAAMHVKAYFDYWEAHTTANRALTGFGAENPGAMWHIYHRAAAEYGAYPPESFERAERILDSAAEAAAGAERDVYARRVEFLHKGLIHARKMAALGEMFLDDDVSDQKLREAVVELVEYRHQIEHLHVANLFKAARNDIASWQDRFDFEQIGEEQ